jgi:hypothetical protein
MLLKGELDPLHTTKACKGSTGVQHHTLLTLAVDGAWCYPMARDAEVKYSSEDKIQGQALLILRPSSKLKLWVYSIVSVLSPPTLLCNVAPAHKVTPHSTCHPDPRCKNYTQGFKKCKAKPTEGELHQATIK